jgi:hypothetical protein
MAISSGEIYPSYLPSRTERISQTQSTENIVEHAERKAMHNGSKAVHNGDFVGR